MTQIAVEKIIQEYVKPIFKFSLKRCKNIDDAEDLTQEIVLKIYRILLNKSDIQDLDKYIWTIARNEFVNFYRKNKQYVGLTCENVIDYSFMEVDLEIINKDNISKLYKEISYLSKIQRLIIVEYYYKNASQKDIAKKLDVSVSTVKWHLFDAKQNLKRRMENMIDVNTLQFNPVKFDIMGFNGSAGTMGGTAYFFRSVLSQNIAYSIYREAKSINEIASILGVSPVYVENEVEFLYEYGYLIKKDNKYIANMLIEELDEQGEKIAKLHDETYLQVAKLFVNELYDELINSNLLKSDKIICEYKDDSNYLLWALIPYISANCDNDEKESIKFEEVATIRPDGAFDIPNVTIKNNKEKDRRYYDCIKTWCGPSWTSFNDRMLWCCKSEWSKDRTLQEFWDYISPRSITLLTRLKKEESLSIDEYAFLAKQGFIKMDEDKAKIKIVWIEDNEIRDSLLAIGKNIKNKYKKEIDYLKKPFIKAVLDYTPKHLRKMQEYGLQYLFRSDGWFLVYCIKELLNTGKLKLPKEEQKSSLISIVVPR